MPARRDMEQLEFVPGATAQVVARMRALSVACDGWINLLPGVPDDAIDPPQRGVLSALFTAPIAPVSMCTWVPAPGRRGDERIGILHPRGRHAVSQLAELGVPVPQGWRVSQDHVRHGLIVHPYPGSTATDVLDWMLRAGAALALAPLTGTWQARVYLPRRVSGNSG
jgi:hypothetical protein